MRDKLKRFLPLLLGSALMMASIVCFAYASSSGGLMGEIEGFALDSENRLYVGVTGMILRLQEGQPAEKIYPQQHLVGPYCFYIENDTLVIGVQREQSVNRFDLEGNLLEKSEMTYAEAKANASYQTLTDTEGNVYTLSRHALKPSVIRCNDTAVYQTTFWDTMFSKTGVSVMTAILIPCMAWVILRAHGKPRRAAGQGDLE